MRRRLPPGSLLAGLLLLPLPGHGDDKPAMDAEFLEFLGSYDSDDEVLNEYLATTDIRKPGQAKGATQPKKTAAEDGGSK